MILKYSRIPSIMFVSVSIAIGIPLTMALINNSSAIVGGWRYVACAFVALCALILIRGVQLLVVPPTVLEITSEGIHIYYNSGTRDFTKEADLLPWQLIESMQLIKVRTRDNSANWSVELLLHAPPSFDAKKRNAIQWSIFGQADPNRFYIDTFVLNLSRENLFAALESGWHQWQKRNKK